MTNVIVRIGAGQIGQAIARLVGVAKGHDQDATFRHLNKRFRPSGRMI